VKYRQLFGGKRLGIGESTGARYDQLVSPDGKVVRSMSEDERADPGRVPQGWRAFQLDNLTSGAFRENTTVNYQFEGETFHPGANACWKTTVEGLDRLAQLGRIQKAGRTLRYRRFLDDFPAVELTNVWDDVAGAADKLYVVQTSSSVVGRCVLMATDPGDLVLDPTCGSGTTAFIAEQWGRRWITIDTSRVPLALARQRLLTATFSYYQLKEPAHGPSGGFVYKRKQNNKGEEVGGIVPHVTLKSIANNEPPDEEVLVDRPETDNKFVRVTGPFVVEATIPTPVDWEGDGIEDSGAESVQSYGSFVERMIEVLRRSPVLHVGGGRKVELGNIRPPAKSLSLSAEGVAFNKVRLKPDTTTDQAITTDRATEQGQPVAFVFGPENGAISEKLVHAALQEAQLKRHTHLYVIGFAIQPHARQLIDHSADMGLVPATYVQATPDLMMGDLLKNMRSSQIFSVCGLPEIKVHKVKSVTPGAPKARPAGAERGEGVPASDGARGSGGTQSPGLYEVELVGLDVFDPITMKTDDSRRGDDVPCWMLDADYNTLCFRASQVFFPRTGAWESLKKALKADYDESVWDHLAGTRSAPFEAGDHKQIAVKVIDDRGNELLVVKALS